MAGFEGLVSLVLRISFLAFWRLILLRCRSAIVLWRGNSLSSLVKTLCEHGKPIVSSDSERLIWKEGV